VLEPWAARQRGAVDPKERYCSVESLLAGWDWRVYRPRRQQLVVAENVVSMCGVAAGAVSLMPEAWTRHGIGVGFGNCARINVPLAPDLGLVLTPRGQAAHSIGAAEFNRATICNSREFVAHHPDWLPGQSLRQAFDEDVWTQRWVLPVILEGSTSRARQGASTSLLCKDNGRIGQDRYGGVSQGRCYVLMPPTGSSRAGQHVR
jgi:hypothetical protein